LILQKENELMVMRTKEVKKLQELARNSHGFVVRRRAFMKFRRAVNQLRKDFLEFEEVIVPP